MIFVGFYNESKNEKWVNALCSKFIKVDEMPYVRCDINEYSKMDINHFFKEALPKIARHKNEKWEHFEKRRRRAEEALNTFVFGRFYGKLFELKAIPCEYSDYQYAKNSEFGNVARRGIIAVGSISIDTNEVLKLQTCESTDSKGIITVDRVIPNNASSVNKINAYRIGYPFAYWGIQQYLLNNTINCINESCDDNGLISVTRWLTATGKSGCTREIESLNEGCLLKWIQKTKNSSTELIILSPNGMEIGEINWKTEDGYMNDTEYNAVYEPLLRSGCVDIGAIKLHRIIPHNAPNGRPRKALVQVSITFHIRELKEDKYYLAQIKRDIQTMRTLAAIDYNRKCDVIEGRIPDKLASLEDLFCDDEFFTDKPFVTYDIFRSQGFLSGSTFSASELEEIWSVYMPIEVFCSLKQREDPLIKYGKERLYCKKHYFNYMLESSNRSIIPRADDSV